MTARPQTPEELNRHLTEQLGFLERSCRAYDEGDETEAKRLAVTLRVLLHDTRRSQSLLTSCGLKDVRFFDSAQDPIPGNWAPTFGLVHMRLGPGWGRYVAPLTDTGTDPIWLVKFDEWWNRTVILIPEQFELSRRDLVLTMADQDGGAHVDPEIEERYYRLTRENALGITVPGQQPNEALGQIETASVRQITEEVRHSLATRETTIKPDIEMPDHIFCRCKSGLPYSRCHKAGGVNAGR